MGQGQVRLASSHRKLGLNLEFDMSDVYVKGHFRKGKYIAPYYKTRPTKGNPTNNYSFPGNYNPHKREYAKGTVSSYLYNNYEKERPSSPTLFSASDGSVGFENPVVTNMENLLPDSLDCLNLNDSQCSFLNNLFNELNSLLGTLGSTDEITFSNISRVLIVDRILNEEKNLSMLIILYNICSLLFDNNYKYENIPLPYDILVKIRLIIRNNSCSKCLSKIVISRINIGNRIGEYFVKCSNCEKIFYSINDSIDELQFLTSENKQEIEEKVQPKKYKSFRGYNQKGRENIEIIKNPFEYYKIIITMAIILIFYLLAWIKVR